MAKLNLKKLLIGKPAKTTHAEPPPPVPSASPEETPEPLSQIVPEAVAREAKSRERDSESEGVWKAYVSQEKYSRPTHLKPTIDLANTQRSPGTGLHAGKQVTDAFWRSTTEGLNLRVSVYEPSGLQQPKLLGVQIQPASADDAAFKTLRATVKEKNIPVVERGDLLIFHKDATRRLLGGNMIPPRLQESVLNWLENQGVPLPGKSNLRAGG